MIRFAVALLALVAVCLSPGCSKEEENNGQISLALNWKPEPQFGGFYAAQQAGAFTSRGLTVDILPGGSGTPTIQMVGAGKVDYAIVSGDELLIARENGNDVVALFAVYQTNPQGIMTHADRGFSEIGQVFSSPGLLAMQQGLPYADFLIKRYGKGQVQIIPYPGGVANFLNDKNYSQQCFVTSEPLAVRQAGGAEKTFLIADAGYNPYTTVLVTRRQTLDKNPEQAKQVVAAVREGWAAYLADPKSTNQFMHNLNNAMDESTYQQAAEAQKPLIETDFTRANGLGAMTADRWSALAQQLVDLKVLKQMPKIDDCFVNLK